MKYVNYKNVLSRGICFFSQRWEDWTNRFRKWLLDTSFKMYLIEIYDNGFTFFDQVLIIKIYTFKRLHDVVYKCPKWAEKWLGYNVL